jgi:hypothetical protein
MGSLKPGESAMEAAGRMYHPAHFACEGCATPFREDEPFYEREGAPYCAKCNVRLFGTCAGCSKHITEAEARKSVSALGRNWHAECFCCAHCGNGFAASNGQYFTKEDDNGVVQPYCEADFLQVRFIRC